MSSAATCKVNQRWHTALAGKRFKYETDYHFTVTSSYGGGSYDSYKDVLKDCKKSAVGTLAVEVSSISGMACCGMEELTFESLQKSWSKYQDDKDWPELVAKYIKSGLGEEDNRILVVGVPVKVGASSQYNIDFYNRLRETLESFGFRQIGVPYKNSNSQNTIVVLAGQL